MIRETHPLDVMHLLKTLRGDMRPDQSAPTQIGFVGLRFYAKQSPLRTAAVRDLTALQIENERTIGEGDIYRLADNYEHAIAGQYRTVEEIEAEMREFVRPYVEDLRNCHPRLLATVSHYACNHVTPLIPASFTTLPCRSDLSLAHSWRDNLHQPLAPQARSTGLLAAPA